MAARGGIYRRLLGAQVRGQASYRASFVFELVSNALIPIIDIIAVLAMFLITRTLGGFTAMMSMIGMRALETSSKTNDARYDAWPRT